MKFKYFPQKELHQQLDSVQKEAMLSLNISKEDVIITKRIYDFISRFAHIEYGENNYKNKEYSLDEIWVGSKKIPPRTKSIIKEIGSQNLFLFFSPFAYTQNNGENFKKLYRILAKQTPFHSYEFYCNGLISQIKAEDSTNEIYDSAELSKEINSGGFPTQNNNDLTLFAGAIQVQEYEYDEENEFKKEEDDIMAY